MKRQQSGFSVIEILLVIVVLGLVGAAGWFVFNRMQDTNSSSETAQSTTGDKQTDSQSAAYVMWGFNGDKWSAAGEAPACAEPYTVRSPMEAKKASSILYPGQVRGGDFKPHGGMGTENAKGNSFEVIAVTDAYLYRGSRYIEAGVVQYMFDFINPCGFMYRLDHLAELSPEFKKYADQLPEAKPNESRTTNYQSSPIIKQGTLVATKIGTSNNPFFDFGLYDLRQPNEASKTQPYQTDSLRIQDKEQSFFAVCWLDYIAGTDQAILKALPARGIEGKASDYCK